MGLPATVTDIPSLIDWLAETHHGGAASAMSRALGVSISTPSFWKRGVVVPKLENLARISETYGIPLTDLVPLTRKRRRRPRPISGGSGPLQTQAVAQVPDVVLLIRHWLRQVDDFVVRLLLPQWLPA